MSRERQAQPPSRDERLPWDQQHHRHRGNHGSQVHPVGGEEVSELRHVRGHQVSTGVKKGALTRSPGGPGRPAGPGSPRAPRFPSSPAGPGGP